jgi:hypothetical protein
MDTNVLEKPAASIFRVVGLFCPEDEGISFLQNVI